MTGTTAFAAAAGPADSSDDSLSVAEVVVTATRREESVSKVPISLSVMTQETMDVKGIKDINDVARLTPGVTVDASQTNAISIRGISSSGGYGQTRIEIAHGPNPVRGIGFQWADSLCD